MKKWINSTLLLLLVAGSTAACDICGCAAGGSYLGILPQYRKHFAGLHYKYQEFTSTHPAMSGETVPVQSDDYFQSLTAWGRFYPAERVQLFAFVPYHYNTVAEPGLTTNMAGIGDVQVLANYMLINNADTGDAGWKHTLLAGGGIKLPTGKNGFTNKEGLILSNMQPGTGSWDFIVNTNYTIRYAKWGLNADAMVRIPTVNPRDYRYGNRFSNGYSIFYWNNTGNISWLPQAGIRYEWSAKDMESYKYRIANPYSGGYQLYANAGAGIYIGPVAVHGLVNLPVSEHYAGGLVKSRGRFEAQIQYLF